MESLRSIGVACSGPTVPSTKSRLRVGWRVEQRQLGGVEGGNLDSYPALMELQKSLHVFFISAGVQSQMEHGESWPDREHNAYKHRYTHTHTHTQNDIRTLPTLPLQKPHPATIK